MQNNRSKGAVNALLAEYKKAVNELQYVIKNVSPHDLVTIVDPLTENPDCKSIQTILAHVVRSGFSYCVYIQNLRSIDSTRPEKIYRKTVKEFNEDLDKVLQFTNDTFANIFDDELEEFDNNKKMHTAWEQNYDIEQIMEHAIVHILRHRRQVESFKSLINK